MERYILEGLQPAEVFKYFEEISNIPRGSGDEKQISDYLVRFAKINNLEVYQDEVLNVIIKKPASNGYEKVPSVILQGHMDMVNEKNQMTVHDFQADPIELKVIGDMIYANGTTLGADNGIALAFSMAVLADKNAQHPALEVVFTTAEETGMDGAIGLNCENLNSKILINIDSEEEGKLLVSCAGGLRARSVVPLEMESIPDNFIIANIQVRGLVGGHSGMDIDKGRGNSNKILGRLLKTLYKDFPFYIVALNGGSKTNAIPREADGLIAFEEKYLETINSKIDELGKVLRSELRTSDKDVTVKLELTSDKAKSIFNRVSTEKVIKLLYLFPNGIETMCMDIASLVESSNNVGVITTTKKEFILDNAVRSSVKSLKLELVSRMEELCKLVGAEFYVESDYPEWQYNPDSKIRNLFEKVYRGLTGKDPEIIAIHAGLECGIFAEKIEGIDMISFGPDVFDVHTPKEHMSISSVERTYNYFLEVLKEMKNY